MKRATSNDVARIAGVSQTTVSLILNNSDRIAFSNETREKVFAAAREVGYQLPKRKKAQSSTGTQLLLVLVPTLANPYYSELIRAIEDYANTLNYRMIICNTFRKPDLEKYYLSTFASGQADGMIYTFLPRFPHMVEQIALATPTVIIGEKQENLSICSIALNNVSAGSMLAEHLYQLGHRKMAFISTPVNQFSLAREQRLEGIQNQLALHGLAGSLQMCIADPAAEMDFQDSGTPYEYFVGRQMASGLIKSGTDATALIGVNDMTALGIINELSALGYHIPKDFSVCGFDNIFSSCIATPALTTIDHHLYVRGQAAVDMLVSIAKKDSPAANTAVVNRIEYMPQLIVRHSTGSAPRK